jgi:hypothetical protein
VGTTGDIWFDIAVPEATLNRFYCVTAELAARGGCR